MHNTVFGNGLAHMMTQCSDLTQGAAVTEGLVFQQSHTPSYSFSSGRTDKLNNPLKLYPNREIPVLTLFPHTVTMKQP